MWTQNEQDQGKRKYNADTCGGAEELYCVWSASERGGSQPCDTQGRHRPTDTGDRYAVSIGPERQLQPVEAAVNHVPMIRQEQRQHCSQGDADQSEASNKN